MDAYRWALGQHAADFAAKFVLLIIADYFNDGEHRAWPSIGQLAEVTEMNRSTVKRAIERLQHAGLVEVQEWLTNSGANQLSNSYYLPMYDAESQPSEARFYVEFGADGKPIAYGCLFRDAS